MSAVRRGWFSPPWGFAEAALFSLFLVGLGFLVEFLGAGSGFSLPSWPYNGLILLMLALTTAVMALFFRSSPLVSWLGGIPAGLCLILSLALLSFIGGIVPQEALGEGSVAGQLGFNRIFSSWPFVFIVFFFLMNLGLSLVWKLVPFRTANLQFIFFHAGFWIALGCGLFGSADLQRLVVPVREGQSNAVGFRMVDNTIVELPFSIQLHDFDLEEYPPQLLLYDPEKESFMLDRSQAILQVAKGVKAVWGAYDVEVVEYLPSALPGNDGRPVVADSLAGVPFARVRVSNAGGPPGEAWLSTGGPMLRPSAVPLDGGLLVMVPGSPKAYRSEVTLVGDGGRREDAVLEVNMPVSFEGWKLYQMGYDEEAGKWSRLSLLEAIRDPWLPAVYLGFFLMMAGNTLYFWKGINRREAV